MSASSQASTTSPSSNKRTCVFCRIAQGEMKPGRKENPQELLFENEQVVAFADGSPVSDWHVLVIPKRHARTCWDLTPALLEEIERVAQELISGSERLSDPPPPNTNYFLTFFSRPPFVSVGHAHLHVIRLPMSRFSLWNPLHWHYKLPPIQVSTAELRSYLKNRKENITPQ